MTTSTRSAALPLSFLTVSLPGGHVQLTDSDGRIFVSKGKPSMFKVKEAIAAGARPEGSAKWEFVGEVESPEDAEECEGCEFCDGERGHSKGDSRRKYERSL